MTHWKETEYNTLLKPGVMIMLYARGAFPMANQNGIIEWYLPETRTIIPLDNYNYPRSLRKFIEQKKPKLVVCGHLHFPGETMIGKSRIINPGKIKIIEYLK